MPISNAKKQKRFREKRKKELADLRFAAAFTLEDLKSRNELKKAEKHIKRILEKLEGNKRRSI